MCGDRYAICKKAFFVAICGCLNRRFTSILYRDEFRRLGVSNRLTAALSDDIRRVDAIIHQCDPVLPKLVIERYGVFSNFFRWIRNNKSTVADEKNNGSCIVMTKQYSNMFFQGLEAFEPFFYSDK